MYDNFFDVVLLLVICAIVFLKKDEHFFIKNELDSPNTLYCDSVI